MILQLLMRHNKLVMFEADKGGSGTGQGGEGQTPGAAESQTSVTTPGSDPTKTGGDADNDDKDLMSLLGTNKKLQSDFDRIVNEKLKNVREKERADRDAAIQAAIKEALEAEKMSAKEREDLARKKEREAIDKEKAEVAEAKRQLSVVDKLNAAKLPLELREYITASDEEGMSRQVEGLTAIIESKVAAIAQKKLEDAALNPQGKIPPATGDAAMQAEFRALIAIEKPNPTERRRLDELKTKMREIKDKQGK